jgi:hypothetical protein
MRDCIRGASHGEIAADLADFVAKDLARALTVAKAKAAQAKAEAELNAAPKAIQPAPGAGKLLDRINLPGAHYFNFLTQSADPACGFDANCAAWTYVRPGPQGPQGLAQEPGTAASRKSMLHFRHQAQCRDSR